MNQLLLVEIIANAIGEFLEEKALLFSNFFSGE